MALKPIIMGLAAFTLLAGQATAQQQTCLPRENIVAALSDKYDEKLVGRGLQGQARLFEVFISIEGDSWTLLQSFPNGVSCIMAAGTDWQQNDLAAVFSVEG